VFGLSNSSDYGISNKKLDFSVEIFTQNNCKYILYINNDRNPRTFDHKPGPGQAVTELHLSPPREEVPLTYYVVFHNNSLLLSGSKIIVLNLYVFGGVDVYVW
jgi:hypothetical protein